MHLWDIWLMVESVLGMKGGQTKIGSKSCYNYQHLQRGAKWFLMGSIHHPLGFNWHPFEGPGSWWLNQPMWNICSSKWVHLPQFFGVKIPKNGWNQLPDYLNDWMHWQLNSPVHMIKLPLNHRKNLRFPICWWLNQLLLKNVSQIGSFPQGSGWK